jgi:hypothetical protein
MSPRAAGPAPARLWTLAALAGLAAVCWFGLGMSRGMLLSSDVKSRCWPWAPYLHADNLQAPLLSDPVWQFVPWLEFARRELLAGRLPLWNPHQDGGVPLLGNGQAAIASPLVLPALLLGVKTGWNLTLLLRILVAAMGTFLWLRDGGRSRRAACLGAAMFALSGPFVAWLEHPHTLTAAAVPFVLLFARRIARNASVGSTVGLALATATVLLGGHPETACIAAIVVLLFTVGEVGRARASLHVLGSAVTGALLAAPAVLPLLEYFSLSAARYGAQRHPFVLPLASLVRFVAPHAHVGHPIEAAATVSLVGLALAVVGAVACRHDRRQMASLGVAALLLLLAYDNPLARLMAAHTPIYWSRAIIFLPLPLGFLAAGGLDALGAFSRWRLGRRASAALSAGLVLAAGVELLVAARGVHAVTPAAEVDRQTPLLRRLAAETQPFRVLPLHTFLPPNSATALGLDDVRGYDALAPRAWRKERDAMGHFTSTSTVTDVLEPWNLAPGGRALDLWNVKYLLLHPQLPYTAARLNREFGLDLEEVYLGADGRLLLNRRVLPRARLEGGGEVRVEEAYATRWLFRVTARADTWLVLADPMFPGWQADVDGRPAAIASAVGSPIRVAVPAGRHVVGVEYRPLSFRLGVGLACAGLVVLGAVVGRGARANRPDVAGQHGPPGPGGAAQRG